jgi:hypothetical protein
MAYLGPTLRLKVEVIRNGGLVAFGQVSASHIAHGEEELLAEWREQREV